MPGEKPQWKELFSEVIATGLCTGCAACIAACPYDVLKYDDSDGVFKPYHVDEEGGPYDCTHGQRGCTLCTRACPRFRQWEAEADAALFGASRSAEEPFGKYRFIELVRSRDDSIVSRGQDGGFVSTALIYMLESDQIDAALVCYEERGEDGIPRARPGLARNREEVLAASGSRYTYSANTLAYLEAASQKLERLALVGMSCQASIPAIVSARKAGKIARRLVFSFGLLCSKTFDERIFTELFRDRYGIEPSQIEKINIKGVFQIWLKDGGYTEVPLKEGHAFTREGCKLCPDFAAEHADISVGGIGELSGYSLCVVRTEKGQQLLEELARNDLVERKPIEEDQKALRLLTRLSIASRKRWPAFAAPGPQLLPP